MSDRKITQGSSTISILLLATILVSFIIGCQPTLQQRFQERYGEEINLSAFELLTAVRDLARSFSNIIEEAADEIIAKSSHSDVRRNALLWKTNAIPAAYTAIFRPDPVAALIDTWAFSIQMVHYFDRGGGKNLFGEYTVIALDASKRLEAEVLHLAELTAPDAAMADIEEKLQLWASKHPIEGRMFHRDSIMPDYARFIEDPELSVFAQIGKLSVDLSDISYRLSVYSEFLPRQARWQAELLVEDLNATGGVKAEVAGLSEVLNSVIPLVEQLPDLIARERVAFLQALREERVATFESIDQQRVSTLDRFTQERIATIAALREERIATLEEIDAIGNRIVDNALARTEGLIDHTFLRTAQLLAALLVLSFIMGIFILAVFFKKK